MTAAKLDTLVPTGAPDGTPERVAAAVTREALKQLGRAGGGRALWVIVGALTVALTVHIYGDGSVRAKADRTEELVEWLVLCELARQQGEKPPVLPFRIR